MGSFSPLISPIEPDENSLEALQGGLFESSCDQISTLFDILNTFAGTLIEGPKSLGETIQRALVLLQQTLQGLIAQVEIFIAEIDKLLTIDEFEVFDPIYLDWYTNSPYIRRILGEFVYWQTWEALKLVESLPEIAQLNLLDLFKRTICDAVKNFISKIEFEGVDTVLKIINNTLIPVLYNKSLGNPFFLIPWLYPQVTTRSVFKVPDRDGIGTEVHSSQFRLPIFAIPDPDDLGLSDFLSSGKLSDLQLPLINQTVYDESKRYWISNWRSINTPAINGDRIGAVNQLGIPIRVGPFFPSIDDGKEGPTLSDQVNHRLSIISAFAEFDELTGVTFNMKPWTVAAPPDPLNPSAPTQVPDPDAPFQVPPDFSSWAFIDVLYEMHMVVTSVDGVCRDAPIIIAKWAEILEVLGIAKFIEDLNIDEEYLNRHQATFRINNDPVVFGTKILEAFGAPAIALQLNLNASIQRLEDSLNRLCPP